MKRLIMISATTLAFAGIGAGVFGIFPVKESNAKAPPPVYEVDVYIRNNTNVVTCSANQPQVIKMKHGVKPCNCPQIYDGPYVGTSSTPGKTCDSIGGPN